MRLRPPLGRGFARGDHRRSATHRTRLWRGPRATFSPWRRRRRSSAPRALASPSLLPSRGARQSRRSQAASVGWLVVPMKPLPCTLITSYQAWAARLLTVAAACSECRPTVLVLCTNAQDGARASTPVVPADKPLPPSRGSRGCRTPTGHRARYRGCTVSLPNRMGAMRSETRAVRLRRPSSPAQKSRCRLQGSRAPLVSCPSFSA